MLTFIDVKFIFDSARLGLFSSANSDLVPTLGTSEMSAIFVFTTKTNQVSSPGLLGERCINLRGSCTLDVIGWLMAKFFQIWPSVADYDELCVCL